MSKIALISCTKRKRESPCAAKDLYSASLWFRTAYEFAELVADDIFILSARYGLLEKDKVIDPYEEVLNDKPFSERQAWADKVIGQLSRAADLNNDQFILLASQTYLENLIPHLQSNWRPLHHFRQGEQISRLRYLIDIEKENVKAKVLHMLFNDSPRFDWNRIQEVPFKNGIYIMFEKGEVFEGLDRITRVGTHRRQGRLKDRLRQHFLSGNIKSSILRKNIGRALYGMVEPGDCDNEDLESGISDYLRANLSFACFPVEEEKERLRFEEAIISTLNHQPSFAPGDNWLGLRSPIIEISRSGLWNKQGLDKKPLTDLELEQIKQLLRFGSPHGDTLLNEVSFEKKKTNIRAKGTSSLIREYIENALGCARAQGMGYIDLVSGDIHNALGLKSRMPSVCDVMYGKMGPGDEILHTTPSGKSSTIKIRYYVRQR